MPLTGWQPDPYRRFAQRYFDGEKWTKHVEQGGLRGEDPVGEQLPPPWAALSPEERQQWMADDAQRRRDEKAQRREAQRRVGPIPLKLAVLLLIGAFVIAFAVYDNAVVTCYEHRAAIRSAKAERNAHQSSLAARDQSDDSTMFDLRRKVHEQARDARAADCDISDLVHDDVGRGEFTDD